MGVKNTINSSKQKENLIGKKIFKTCEKLIWMYNNGKENILLCERYIYNYFKNFFVFIDNKIVRLHCVKKKVAVDTFL